MTTPERGIRRARAVAAAVGLAALGAIGLTSGLAYADTEHTAATTTTTGTSSTTGSTDGTAGTTDPTTGTTGDTQTGTGQTDWGTAPTVTSGSGDSHAQTNGS